MNRNDTDDLIKHHRRMADAVERLRASVIDLLWLGIADEACCCCFPGDPCVYCKAWRALGYRGTFRWQYAEKKLTTSKPTTRKP